MVGTSPAPACAYDELMTCELCMAKKLCAPLDTNSGPYLKIQTYMKRDGQPYRSSNAFNKWIMSSNEKKSLGTNVVNPR